MGQDEYKTNTPGLDLFALDIDVHTSYTLDDDNQPDQATIVLEFFAKGRPTGSPVRLHLPAEVVPQLTEIMERQARKSQAIADANRRT